MSDSIAQNAQSQAGAAVSESRGPVRNGDPQGDTPGGWDDSRGRGPEWWPMAVLAVMLVIWFSPILRLAGGWWWSHTRLDDPFRGLGVVEAWRCGLLDARWFPTFDYRYGYPFLSFYAPLFHWMSGAWILLLSSACVAVRVNLFCWLVFGTVGMYLAGERVWGFLTHGKAATFYPGLICAVGWLMSPYPMCNVLVRGALPEFASSQTLPWILWAAFGLLGREGRWSRRDSGEWLLLVLFVSTGILTHNFLGLCVLGIAVAVAPLVLVLKRFGRRETPGEESFTAIRAGGWALALGVALTATIFYWLPAMSESRWVHLDSMKGLGYEHSAHYLYLSNLLQFYYWEFGISIKGGGDPMPLHLGFAGLVAFGSAFYAMALLCTMGKKARRDRLLAGIVGLTLATILGILLSTPLSAFLWDHFPPLQFAQFPWRTLSIPTVGVCLMLPATLIAAKPVHHHREAVTGALILLVVYFAASHHFYGDIYDRLPFDQDFERKNWDRRQILTADLDEYGPIWRDRFRLPKWPAGVPLANDQLEILRCNNRWTALTASVRNKSDQPQPLVIALNYYPAWQGRLEPGGQPLALSPDAATGFIAINGVPPGDSTIHVWFGNTPVRRTCKLVSLVAWLLWGAGWIALAGPGLRKRQSGASAERGV